MCASSFPATGLSYWWVGDETACRRTQTIQHGYIPSLIATIPETIQRQNTWNQTSHDVQTPAQTHLGRKHTNLHAGGQSWSICARWWLTCLFSAGRGHSAAGARTEPELPPQKGHGADSSALPVWYPAHASPVALKTNKGTTQRTTSSWKKAEPCRRVWLHLGTVN